MPLLITPRVCLLVSLSRPHHSVPLLTCLICHLRFHVGSFYWQARLNIYYDRNPLCAGVCLSLWVCVMWFERGGKACVTWCVCPNSWQLLLVLPRRQGRQTDKPRMINQSLERGQGDQRKSLLLKHTFCSFPVYHSLPLFPALSLSLCLSHL